LKTVLTLLSFSIIAFAVINYTTNAKNNDSSIELKSNINLDGDKKLNNISSIKVKGMNGKDVALSSYKGKVLLIVNVASKCGYTPQYKGLQDLYEKYKNKGFEILGFPCNDFGGQEPGSNEEIQEFCSMNFGVTFKLFDKVKILGNDKDKLYSVLTDNDVTGTKDVRWNFEKFLIAKNGDIVARFPSKVEPTSKELIIAIEAELKK
jgi:glutathione peroxidase